MKKYRKRIVAAESIKKHPKTSDTEKEFLNDKLAYYNLTKRGGFFLISIKIPYLFYRLNAFTNYNGFGRYFGVIMLAVALNVGYEHQVNKYYWSQVKDVVQAFYKRKEEEFYVLKNKSQQEEELTINLKE